MSAPTLIGLTSPMPQCGKTTVASTLCEHGYARAPFAFPLKQMVIQFLRLWGLAEVEICELMERHKEQVIPELGVSVRHLCQTLGTEWGRSCISPKVWVAAWERRWATPLAAGARVVVDDVRFPEEAEMIQRLGGKLIWLDRRDHSMPEQVLGHASEGSLSEDCADLLPLILQLEDLHCLAEDLVAGRVVEWRN
jgi:hypothetical protein